MNTILAWIASLILGMSVVWKWVTKWSPKIKRALAITDETLDVLRTVLDAVEDGKVTRQEIEEIMIQVEQLQEVLKS